MKKKTTDKNNILLTIIAILIIWTIIQQIQISGIFFSLSKTTENSVRLDKEIQELKNQIK